MPYLKYLKNIFSFTGNQKNASYKFKKKQFFLYQIGKNNIFLWVVFDIEQKQ